MATKAKTPNAKQDSANNMIELNILDQQLRQMEEQARKVEQVIYEQQMMESSLDELKGNKSNDVMIPIGPGLFVPGKIEKTDYVLMHIGGKVISRKKLEDAKKIIEKRKNDLMKEGDRMSIEMQKVLVDMAKLETKIRNSQGSDQAGHNHEHEHACNCEDENCDECN